MKLNQILISGAEVPTNRGADGAVQGAESAYQGGNRGDAQTPISSPVSRGD
jgi:hypothetical protein